MSRVPYGSGRVHRNRRTGRPISRRWAKGIALTFLVVVAVVASLDKIMERGERAECFAWKEQASHNSIFYLTGGQAEQCKVVGVSMKNIPVKG
ncbi:MAG: hypothetical protein Q8P66_02775 [Candidatus Colwellbacteria bacterium]|nr:hypothetical protein [Candidatus Colwellbacteria bacterium]